MEQLSAELVYAAVAVVAVLALLWWWHRSRRSSFATVSPRVGRHTFDRPARREPAAAPGVDPGAVAELAALTSLGVY